jgi:hypothetical protein
VSAPDKTRESTDAGLVEQLRELLAKATPGEWTVSPFRAWVVSDKFGNDGDFLPICAMLWPTDERTEAETYANAELITETRRALPHLLDRIAALEARVATAERERDEATMAADNRGHTIRANNAVMDLWVTRALAAEQQAAEMREALEPFALVADEYDRWQAKGSTTDESRVRFGYGRARFGMAEFRRARATLAKFPASGEVRS